ncbi:TetR family transcriptional regulator [Melghirimyces profundicolus]|uniref:TetR family transcriptional regulator n=1 Tax=Melghirimyces profundicolus TaxID=1242148 RepID=A0A2T6BCC2_9BACL|nr:TetR/AcrR family transcriptional regulator [Melghirimyces profundicolus]PTX53692.1 TetR family transcriptional regulator [Melghirimyces profundicolus]
MPKIIDHDEYREELLHQCFDLFAEEGYASLSMRRIADELDVSTGTLYHYFSGKEDLFNQLVELITCRDLFDAKEALKGAKTPDERIDALLRFVEERETYFLNQSFIWMDYYRHQVADRDPDPRLGETLEQYRSGIARILDVRDPELAEFILTVINGWVLQRYFNRGKPPVETLSRMLRRLIHGR